MRRPNRPYGQAAPSVCALEFFSKVAFPVHGANLLHLQAHQKTYLWLAMVVETCNQMNYDCSAL